MGDPELILGHGRVTGPAAFRLAEHFPDAQRLHFIHMAPDEIEWHKLDRKDDAAEVAERRHEIELGLGQTADYVVTVGPRLFDRYRLDFSAYDGDPNKRLKKVICLNPGFDVESPEPRTIPPGEIRRILITGRMEDHRLKGLDIAAKALGITMRRDGVPSSRIEFMVRGVPVNESEEVRRRIIGWSGEHSLNVIPRLYSPNARRLKDELRTASLVLMPSRAEGFGLVGLEAINLGAPILISSESGLARLLEKVLDRDGFNRTVVPVTNNLDEDAATWSARIGFVLYDREAAFGRADEMRRLLGATRTWRHAVEELLSEL